MSKDMIVLLNVGKYCSSDVFYNEINCKTLQK